MRRFHCGACRLAGHTIRSCPDKVLQAKERSYRLRVNLPAAREEYLSWIWDDITALLDSVDAIK